MYRADINQLSDAVRNACIDDIFRTADIDLIKLFTRAAGDGDDSRAVYHTALSVRTVEKRIKR